MSQTTHKAAAAARAAAQGRTELRTALLEERRGYVQRGDKDRVAQVDEQVDLLGPEPEPEPESDEPETAAPKRGRGSVKVAEAKAAQAAQAKVAAETAPQTEPEQS